MGACWELNGAWVVAFACVCLNTTTSVFRSRLGRWVGSFRESGMGLQRVSEYMKPDLCNGAGLGGRKKEGGQGNLA